MTTVIVITAADQHAAVREALESEVDPGEFVYFVRLPSVRCLGELLEELAPASAYGVEYAIEPLPGEATAAGVVDLARERGADRICIAIADRTLTGKARINDMTQSILLHSRLTGELIVGEELIVLDDLSFD